MDSLPRNLSYTNSLVPYHHRSVWSVQDIPWERRQPQWPTGRDSGSGHPFGGHRPQRGRNDHPRASALGPPRHDFCEQLEIGEFDVRVGLQLPPRVIAGNHRPCFRFSSRGKPWSGVFVFGGVHGVYCFGRCHRVIDGIAEGFTKVVRLARAAVTRVTGAGGRQR